MPSELHQRIDTAVARCRALVEKHGGQSDDLAKLRSCYKLLHSCPEAGALVLIEVELERLEAVA